VPGLKLRSAPVTWLGSAELDNLTVRPVAHPVRRLANVPQAGRLLASYSDEFHGGSLGAGWTWLRPDARAKVADGKLSWPVQTTDLVGPGNNAGLLFRDTPNTDSWIVETKLHLDLGEYDIRNYQQAGLIAHRSDDDFARLGHVSIWQTRQTEYGRELVARPSDGATIYGAAAIGRAAPILWMRLAYHRNAAGEHLYRAATSTDGKKWVWGATWALAPGPQPKIGLYAHGDQTPAAPDAVATFDYLRFYTTK
jgi:arabinan endo-1,5-alpha-L-arabinosidase